MEERKELNEALKRQEKHVQEEVKEAQGAAAKLNTDSERAAQELQRTQNVQRVEAEVRTETRTVPGGGTDVQVTREQEQIPIERNRVIETQRPSRGTAPENTQPSPGNTQPSPSATP